MRFVIGQGRREGVMSVVAKPADAKQFRLMIEKDENGNYGWMRSTMVVACGLTRTAFLMVACNYVSSKCFD